MLVDEPAADPIQPKLEAARRELLDLGLRNALINYRPLRARGVEVVDERPVEVFRLLVPEGRRLSFLPAPEPPPRPHASQPALLPEPEQAEELPQPEEEIVPAGPAARHADVKLQTAETSERLQHRLLQTYYAARTYVEEQGANILFLALGMLEWYEVEASQDKRRAPLLLVPVELERAAVTDRFHLRYTGEEIDDNLSLAAKMHAEFGIILPELPQPEDLDLEAWFDAVAAAIASQPRWAVDRHAVALGFFSFGKFLMYRDLDVATWPESTRPTEHPLIVPLLNEAGFAEPPPAIPDDAFLDPYIRPSEIHQVVDADSTQTLAILDVNSGRNLVVQGPPGTGKSQTITNVIAEAIGAGRKVLFVAEKMAALEVVKRRLDTVGLGDACLELHSHKISKRAVLSELARTLDLGRPKLAEMQSELALLEEHRARLNVYADAVNAPVGASGVTPYRAYGELLRLRRLPGAETWPRFELPAMSVWTEVDFSRREALVAELQARLAAIGVPASHRFWGARKSVVLPSDTVALRERLVIARPALDALVAAAGVVARHLRLAAPPDAASAEFLLASARRAQSAPRADGLELAAPEWRVRGEDLRALLAAGARYADLRDRHGERLIPEIWEQDVLQLRQDLAAYEDSWWRFLSGRYRRAKAMLAGYCRGGLPDGIAAQVALLDDVLEARRHHEVIRRHAALGQALFGVQWRDERSDWTQLTAWADWTTATHAEVAAGNLHAGMLDYLAAPGDQTELATTVAELEHALPVWRSELDALVALLDFDPARRFGPGASLDRQPFSDLAALLDAWTAQPDELAEMAAFTTSAETCRREGIGEVAEAAERWPEASMALASAFARGWYSVLVEQALRERPALATFDAAGHEHVAARFRELDQQVLAFNRSRLALQHWQRLPQHEAGGQLGVLRREMAKKARHLPIRRLMAEAGNAIQAVKPVFMMSPMSIATYIPPGTVTFDLVIFDEASQVKPVDAFGALARGRQAVVVGDKRQLPPTSFFEQLTAGEELPDSTVEEPRTSGMESILALFEGQQAPSRMLRWHYRSRHESLIAVSNHEFYEDKLVVFPSPDAARETAGLVLHHLTATAYERGTSRTNRDEARVVAEAVMAHARRSPNLTLGVAAFSQPQAEAILAQLELLRRQDPSLEPFFAAHPHEPFFVKNLENVQGDERDVVYISVGYGRTTEGYVSMNFGPLNAEGGERRLNVLITRARSRCEVFTNLTADDIDLNRTQARGVVALKRFLRYAQTGNLDVPQPTGADAGSPFEEEVHAALVTAGYQVERQVGSAGFRIDLAVVDPRKPGRYLLGIECDGATYHSARSARDRDRLRQQVLEGLGWHIHRIWSTDWFRNPERELRRAVAVIQGALAQGRAPGPDPSPPSAPTAAVERVAHPAPAAGSSVVPPYQLAQPAVALLGLELHEVPARRLARWITEVVEVESPVHIELAMRRVAEAAGVGRIGSRIRAALATAIDDAVAAGTIQRRGDFLWSFDATEPLLRDRGQLDAAQRTLAVVAPEELEAALVKAVGDAFGLEAPAVAPAAIRLLGLVRLTDETRIVVDGVVERLVVDGRLLRVNHQIVLGSG